MPPRRKLARVGAIGLGSSSALQVPWEQQVGSPRAGHPLPPPAVLKTERGGRGANTNSHPASRQEAGGLSPGEDPPPLACSTLALKVAPDVMPLAPSCHKEVN